MCRGEKGKGGTLQRSLEGDILVGDQKGIIDWEKFWGNQSIGGNENSKESIINFSLFVLR